MCSIFQPDRIRDLKAAAGRVLEAVIERKDALDVKTSFDELDSLWESPAVVLFRRSYGNAAFSMPQSEFFQNWVEALDGINRARIYVGFLRAGQDYEQKLLVDLNQFYTRLSVIESCAFGWN